MAAESPTTLFPAPPPVPPQPRLGLIARDGSRVAHVPARTKRVPKTSLTLNERERAVLDRVSQRLGLGYGATWIKALYELADELGIDVDDREEAEPAT